MELSVHRPIFCVHKGSIFHRSSIKPLCRC